MNRKLTFVVFFLVYRLIFSQVTETKGNLLRIDFTKPTIDFSDTLWQWNTNDYEICSNILFIDSTLYLLINTYDDNPYLPWTYLHLYNTATGTKRLLIADHPPIDPLEPLLYSISPFEFANSGCWIFNGIRAPAVFLRNDSLYTFENSDLFPIHSAGKIDNRNLLVFNSISRYDFSFYLEDLSNSPKIENSNKLEIVDSNGFQVSFVPEKICHLKDSLYLYKESLSRTLTLASFADNKIKFIKRLKPVGSHTTFPGLIDWKISNNSIFYIEKRS